MARLAAGAQLGPNEVLEKGRLLDKIGRHDEAFGGTEAIYGFKVGTDQLRFFSEAQHGVQQRVVGGSTVFTLNDGATITLVGVSQLAPGSVGSF